MDSSVTSSEPIAAQVEVTDVELVVGLVDGRRIAVPLVWFPRLLHASTEQRAVFELIGAARASTGPMSMRTSVFAVWCLAIPP